MDNHRVTNKSTSSSLAVSMCPGAYYAPLVAKPFGGGVLAGISQYLTTVALFEHTTSHSVDMVHNLVSVDTIHAMSLIQHNIALLPVQHYLNDMWLTPKSQPWCSVYKSMLIIAPANFLQVIHRSITMNKFLHFQLPWEHLYIDIPAGLKWLLFTQHFSQNDVKKMCTQHCQATNGECNKKNMNTIPLNLHSYKLNQEAFIDT